MAVGNFSIIYILSLVMKGKLILYPDFAFVKGRTDDSGLMSSISSSMSSSASSSKMIERTPIRTPMNPPSGRFNMNKRNVLSINKNIENGRPESNGNRYRVTLFFHLLIFINLLLFHVSCYCY